MMTCVKYGESPCPMMYDALAQLNVKFSATLLSGNIA